MYNGTMLHIALYMRNQFITYHCFIVQSVLNFKPSVKPLLYLKYLFELLLCSFRSHGDCEINHNFRKIDVQYLMFILILQ